jgi:hypothetical protein
MIAPVSGKIVSLVPAEPGWRAIYLGEDDEDRELTRVVAWALVEEEDGAQAVVGMVIDWTDPTRIVAAPDGASENAPEFDRYGFKES